MRKLAKLFDKSPEFGDPHWYLWWGKNWKKLYKEIKTIKKTADFVIMAVIIIGIIAFILYLSSHL